jgi:UDP-glucose:(heptosyl)LPS alpha-1,3-glucosyltransferase
MRGSKIVLSHGDSLTGDICVVHAMVNNASLAEKRRAGYYSWLFNPTNLGRVTRSLDARRRTLSTNRRVFQRVRKQLHSTIRSLMKISDYSQWHQSRSPRDPNAQSRAVVRERFGIPQGVPLLLFVGSQFRLKGLEFAIRALTTMETKAWLLVVGGDTAAPFKRLAEQLGVSDRVIFAGPRADLPQIYPAADAFVFPTLYETFALVCLEAMASGLPVLATPVGGIEDYLVDGVNGFHISRDEQDIGAKLDRLLNDPELQARFREQGLATVGSYAWPKIATQYLRLFDEVARQKAQGFQGFASVAKSVQRAAEAHLEA